MTNSALNGSAVHVSRPRPTLAAIGRDATDVAIALAFTGFIRGFFDHAAHRKLDRVIAFAALDAQVHRRSIPALTLLRYMERSRGEDMFFVGTPQANTIANRAARIDPLAAWRSAAWGFTVGAYLHTSTLVSATRMAVNLGSTDLLQTPAASDAWISHFARILPIIFVHITGIRSVGELDGPIRAYPQTVMLAHRCAIVDAEADADVLGLADALDRITAELSAAESGLIH